MITTDELPTVLNALEEYKGAYAATLPDALRNRIYELSFGSPVDTIVKTAETLYAAIDVVGDPGRRVVGALFYTASFHSFHGVNADNRAGKIIAAMRRDLGEDAPVMGWPEPTEDPAPKAEYTVQIVDPTPTPPPAEPAPEPEGE